MFTPSQGWLRKRKVDASLKQDLGGAFFCLEFNPVNFGVVLPILSGKLSLFQAPNTFADTLKS